MRNYYIEGEMTVGCWTEVEARSEEEALEIASGRDVSELSIAAFTDGIDEAWHFDNDGNPLKIRLRET